MNIFSVNKVIIKFAGKEIPKSPFTVKVEGAAGDPAKVTAAGPGLEKTGVIVLKKTYFEVYTQRTFAVLSLFFLSFGLYSCIEENKTLWF